MRAAVFFAAGFDAAGRAVTVFGRPRRGLRAPETNSVTCAAQRSFTKLPRAALIVTVSTAGFPQASQTKIWRED